MPTDPIGMTWAELKEGQAINPFTLPPVSRTDIVKYQGASGDFDAAHHDDAHARRFGYPGVFSLGMLHGGILGNYATSLFGAENIRRFRVRFRDIVYPGDELSYSGTIARKREEQGLRLVEVDLTCAKSDGSVAVSGNAVFVVP